MMNAAAFVVALMLFSSPFLFFLPPTTSSCLAVNVLLSFDSRLAFVFFFLSTTVRQPWPVAAKRERKRSEPCHCSFSFILSERTTTKEMSGWWMNIIPFSFLVLFEGQFKHTAAFENNKKRAICDFSFTPPIVFNDQRQAIMSSI